MAVATSWGFIELFILCYGVLFAHLGLFSLFIPGTPGPNRSAARILLSFGVLCASGAFSLRFGLENRGLDYTVYAVLILLGPLALAFIADCFNSRALHRRVFKPTVIMAGILLALGTAQLHPAFPVRFAYVLAYLWIAALLSHIVVAERKSQGSFARLPREMRNMYLVIAGNLALVLAMAAIQLSGRIELMAIPWIVTIVSLVALTGIIFRHPETFRIIGEEAETRRYERSRLGQLDADLLASRLTDLLERERIYREGELRLQDVAKLLDVSAQTLSELVNSRFGTNFNQFVNRYRIAHACDCLASNPDKPVIDVAYDSGFNSKSVFNAAFRQITGMTPRQYRIAARAKQ